MDVSLVNAFIASQAAQTQLAVAAKMLRMNADSAASIIKVIELAQANMRQLSNVASGIGGNLDISV